jgi:hypothetical protein
MQSQLSRGCGYRAHVDDEYTLVPTVLGPVA